MFRFNTQNKSKSVAYFRFVLIFFYITYSVFNLQWKWDDSTLVFLAKYCCFDVLTWFPLYHTYRFVLLIPFFFFVLSGLCYFNWFFGKGTSCNLNIVIQQKRTNIWTFIFRIIDKTYNLISHQHKWLVTYDLVL